MASHGAALVSLAASRHTASQAAVAVAAAAAVAALKAAVAAVAVAAPLTSSRVRD